VQRHAREEDVEAAVGAAVAEPAPDLQREARDADRHLRGAARRVDDPARVRRRGGGDGARRGALVPDVQASAHQLRPRPRCHLAARTVSRSEDATRRLTPPRGLPSTLAMDPSLSRSDVTPKSNPPCSVTPAGSASGAAPSPAPVRRIGSLARALARSAAPPTAIRAQATVATPPCTANLRYGEKAGLRGLASPSPSTRSSCTRSAVRGRVVRERQPNSRRCAAGGAWPNDGGRWPLPRRRLEGGASAGAGAGVAPTSAHT
jgi:hypothetical protein